MGISFLCWPVHCTTVIFLNKPYWMMAENGAETGSRVLNQIIQTDL
jgi:hypothetical protein